MKARPRPGFLLMAGWWARSIFNNQQQGDESMSTLDKPEASERPRFGTTTEREPGTGDIVVRNPDGRVVERIPADQAQKPSK